MLLERKSTFNWLNKSFESIYKVKGNAYHIHAQTGRFTRFSSFQFLYVLQSIIFRKNMDVKLDI